jgi:hypothetical protein
VAGSVCGECPGGSGSAVAQPEERHCGTIGEFAADVGERSAVPHVKGGKLRPASRARVSRRCRSEVLVDSGVVPCLSWCLIGVSACSAVGVSGELLDPSVITIEEFTMPVRSPSVVDLTAEQLKLYT